MKKKETPFVWWYIDSSVGTPAYTLARDLGGAKSNFGGMGYPRRVVDEQVIASLDMHERECHARCK